jgi:CHAT domain-containing protein
MWVRQLPGSCDDVADALGQLRFQMNKFSFGPKYRQRHAVALQQGTDDALHCLYNILLSPIAQQLTTETLIIVPHNLLHYVPFHALFDGKTYLLEQKTVSYAPSATILHRVLTGEKQVVTQPPLILGLPDEAILHTQTEVETIGALFPDAKIYLGQEATVDSLANNNNRPAFLHLSTHAVFRSDNPLFSALKLADGWVTVNDIYDMADSAPLVTLSACETGRNQVTVGDELVGLCRGFFSVGAKSLVVSLWAAEDSSTARLMAQFYRGLRAGQPVNHALRAAQLEMKSELGHPYYWAPFILTGNPQTHLSSLHPGKYSN